MRYAIHQIDAFTDRLFGGNPAAVVPMDEWLPDDTLQAIAAENNLAETAFVIPGDTCKLRWFTPTLEMNLCGHATLAAAYVLFREHMPECERIDFETHSGKVSVTRSGDVLSLDFPARAGEQGSVATELAGALGTRPVDVRESRDRLAVFEDEATVCNLRPDLEAITNLDTFAVIATAPGTDVDFVSRFFAPGAGVPEDPVTGSAHCTLIPYWAERLGRQHLSARQVSARGGDLDCEWLGERVRIGGRCVEYLRGSIEVS
ncbi:PhzF family phenazine biosynthesis protein [Salicola sp. Rm-C-2C1-2]|uniref:PhzF family phenazine biosynthesis protein n=1 Tax=Salicola sp. Rm-C-2C1-2 TaxID=3141321 RepID=UPI0032E4BA57